MAARSAFSAICIRALPAMSSRRWAAPPGVPPGPPACRARRAPAAPEPAALKARLDDELRARVHAVERLTPKIVEVVVRAPIAARAFQPGQFYRLQNYEHFAARVDGTTLAMEGLALTGAGIDTEAGRLSTVVL